MVTKEQAIQAGESFGRIEFHYGECKRFIGPRGGVRQYIETWRVNGKCKIWVTKPEDFYLPIKHGLRDYGSINNFNCSEFHLASECPLDNPNTGRIHLDKSNIQEV